MKPIAIKVENKRQFEALMKHYEGKGWVSHLGYPYEKLDEVWDCHVYGDNYYRFSENYPFINNYNIIPFHAFAQIAGIEVKDEIEITKNCFLIKVNKEGVYINAKEGYVISEEGVMLTKETLESIYAAYQQIKD